MTDAIRRHLLKYPHARSTSLAYQQMKAEKTAQLQAEVATRKPATSITAQSRKSILDRVASWLGRR